MNPKSLFESGHYQELIDALSPSSSNEEILYGLCAYVAINRAEDAVTLFLSKREALFSYNAILTMKLDLGIRFALGQFDEAYEDFTFFSNLPYVSQEVEEVLREVPKLIREEEASSRGRVRMDEDALLNALKPTSEPYVILGALQQLKGLDIAPFEEELVALLSSSIHNDIKTYCLLMLSSKNLDRTVTLNKRGLSYSLNPSKIGDPFQTKEYRLVRSLLSQGKYDPSLSEAAGEILDSYVLTVYPERFVVAGEEEILAKGTLALAKRYFGQSESEEVQIKAMADTIGKILRENPPLQA